ncbi:hypothetical protein E2C01_066565 [Portunus trituberculatus]|uniref:Uncharacterized protein n=1 Tax=Portunus trituberculatus TaxID=210409 RepID=A0A5B7HSN6_PORTR|nr:hypothetical protein [Portunus trituberculatus]
MNMETHHGTEGANEINPEYHLVVVGSSVCLPSPHLIEPQSRPHCRCLTIHHRQHGKFYRESALLLVQSVIY